MRLVKSAAEHPVSVLMVYAAILTFGLVSFRQLPQELLPDLPLPVARVICEYPGLPCADIEALITIPVENALSAVKGVRSTSSVSMDELSAVRLEFDWGVNQNKAAVEIREKIDALYPFLPHGCSKPLVIASEDSSDRPVLTLAVVPVRDRRMQDIGALVRDELSAKLKQVPGVAAVRIVGLAEPEIKVDVDGYKLTAAGVPIQQITAIVATSIYSAPLGTVVEGSREYLVEATTDIATLEDIRRIPVLTSGNSTISLGQFATVYRDVKEPTSFFHHNGVAAIGIFVEKIPGSGSLNTARNLRNTLTGLRPMFAGDVEIQIIDDPSEEIERGIRNLLLAIAFGCAAVFVILLILFRSTAAPLIVSASIPASLMVVFLFMRFAGIGLNLISLSGIAIGIGMIVDNSIVVVDSLIRGQASGASGIASAAGETTKAIVGSTFTTLLVFLPVVFLPGVTGALFRDLALTISCLLFASLLCALTLTPALYSLCLEKVRPSDPGPRRTGGVGSLYARYLRKELRRPRIAPILMTFLVIAGLVALMVLPKRILPETESRHLEIRVEFPPATPIRESRSLSRSIAAQLLESDRIESVFASAGYDRDSLPDRSNPDNDPRRVQFRVAAVLETGGSAGAVMSEMEELMSRFPGIRYTISRPTNTIRRLLGDSDVVVYRLSGADREVLLEEAGSIAGKLEASGSTRAVWIDTRREANRLGLDLNPTNLAFQGAEPAVVLESLRTAVRGQVAAQLPAEGRRIDVRVRLDPGQTATDVRLEKIHVPVKDELVETGVLGTFKRSLSFKRLYRIDRRPAVSLTAHPVSGAKGEVVALLSSGVEARGEVLTVSALQRNQKHILAVFAFALLLMYLMIGAQFESFVLPLLLLLTLVPALSGSLIVLLLCGYSLNINSFLGILILVGTAVNISIILTVGIQSGGRPNRDNLVSVCRDRLTPIAATVLSTVVAMIPVALNTAGEGALQSNTAVALLGGLSVGLVSILLVFPVLYDRIAGVGRWRQ
jgi:HAE1 family hydrophobic/amphiphilic exporter-1